jgi:hypothetical protein
VAKYGSTDNRVISGGGRSGMRAEKPDEGVPIATLHGFFIPLRCIQNDVLFMELATVMA